MSAIGNYDSEIELRKKELAEQKKIIAQKEKEINP